MLLNLLILQYIHLPIQLSIWLQTKANYLPSLDVICTSRVPLNVNTKKLYNHGHACNGPPLTPSSCMTMPGLVRKLLISAAIDGLILQPAPPRNHPPATQQAIKIDYRGSISPLLKDRRDEDTAPASLEAHGIIGTEI
jgi:hypothetical protein